MLGTLRMGCQFSLKLHNYVNSDTSCTKLDDRMQIYVLHDLLKCHAKIPTRC